MARTEIRGNNQIKAGSITRDRLVSNFVQNATWQLSSNNSAILTGLADPTSLGPNAAVTKGYVDTLVDSNLKSPDSFATDSAGNYPTDYKGTGAVHEGDMFYVTDTTNGTTVGTRTVNVGDALVALADNPGNTDANWLIMESNRDQATETVKGVARIATQTEADNGTDDTTIITPLKLRTVLDNSGITEVDAGAGLTETTSGGTKTIDVISASGAITVNPDNIQFNIGNTNGASLELTTTGVELAQNVAGPRIFGTSANDIQLAVTPDGTVDLAVATTKFVKDTIQNNVIAGNGLSETVDSTTGVKTIDLGGDPIIADVNLGNNDGTESINITMTDSSSNSNTSATFKGDILSLTQNDTSNNTKVDINLRNSEITLYGGDTAEDKYAKIEINDTSPLLMYNDNTNTNGLDRTVFNLWYENEGSVASRWSLRHNGNMIWSVEGWNSKFEIKNVQPGSNFPIILNTDANYAQLSNQPDGTVDLAIATTKYVNDQISSATQEVYGEAPAVTAGSTDVTLANTPTAGTLRVYLNGLRQLEGSGNDYTLSGNTVSFADPLQSDDIVIVDYKY